MARIFENDKCVMNMTNREKYRFDDFTIANYRHLLLLAKERGFEFILHKDEYLSDRKDVIWRHDVEFEPDIALTMARIEHELGVIATYFFQLHSPYYNLFDVHYTKVFHQICDLGHHVGMHFDCRYWNIDDEGELDRFITVDRTYLEKVLGVQIDTFSFHNTTPFTQNCLAFKYGGLVNVYSSFFKEHYNYCGDSLGYWRFDRLEEVLCDDNIRHLQVLTHDANWSEKVLSPQQRFVEAINRHADRLIQGQKNGLLRKGMIWPDDDSNV